MKVLSTHTKAFMGTRKQTVTKHIYLKLDVMLIGYDLKYPGLFKKNIALRASFSFPSFSTFLNKV